MDPRPLPLLERPVVLITRRISSADRASFRLGGEAGEDLGEGVEVHPSAPSWLWSAVRLRGGPVPLLLEVRQGDTVVLRLRRPSFSWAVEVADGMGQHIGTIRRLVRPPAGAFDISDTTGRIVGRAAGWCEPEVGLDVVDQGSHPSGRVAALPPALVGMASSAGGETVAVERPPHLVDPLRTLVLALPFAVLPDSGGRR